jgi:undecaprenyl phosphate-alpha-L-ara4FN deformylase
VDVDTLRGTRLGVPRLCRILAAHGIRATFFFSVGPDNMGRNLWRLARPEFRRKMLRTRAGSLYGWDILLRGTLWPGPVIGNRCAQIIRATAAAGHEIGLHAWDHHRWQTTIERMDTASLRRELQLGVRKLEHILGSSPTCSAVPAWKCDDRVLEMKHELGFGFNSDCRGTSIFRPVVGTTPLPEPQVPVTIPTYDEVVGTGSVTAAQYNEFVLDRLKVDALNVHTIHAEVEGIRGADLFDELLDRVRSRESSFVALGDLLDGQTDLPHCQMVRGTQSGREGWVAVQGAPVDVTPAEVR